MRILIYGAGVIGCLYATLFSKDWKISRKEGEMNV